MASEEERQRRALKACLPCKVGKRKCDHGRPCGPCCSRGLQAECLDEVKEVDPACTLCKKRKLKCDRERPCGRCVKQGRPEDCVIEGEAENPQLFVRRKPDSPIKEVGKKSKFSGIEEVGVQSQVIGNKRQKLVPSAALLGGDSVSSHTPAESWQSPDFSRGGDNLALVQSHAAASRYSPTFSTCSDGIASSGLVQSHATAFPANGSWGAGHRGGDNLALMQSHAAASRYSPTFSTCSDGSASSGLVQSHTAGSQYSPAFSARSDGSWNAASGHRGGGCHALEAHNLQVRDASLGLLEPERPMAFPEGTFNGLSNVVPATHDASPWPKSLVRLFKTYRTADVIYERMLRNLSPKLLSTVLSIFRPIDALMLESPPPAPPKEWPQSSSWQSSMRCGMQMVRLDKGGGVMTGVDVNPFWTDLAGLHKEEFISRAFNGDQNIPTSELRQMAKLIIYGMKEFAKIKIATFEGTEYTFNQEPVYSRFSRGWGRGDQSEGVLVRMSNKIKHDGSWMYVHNSLVMVSPEEFEAVRAHQPQLCESYLIPVVGSKSASELMNPRLLVEESFEYMNSCEEGRAQMDKLADVLADEFSFLYDFLARHKLAQPRANCTIAEQQL